MSEEKKTETKDAAKKIPFFAGDAIAKPMTVKTGVVAGIRRVEKASKR